MPTPKPRQNPYQSRPNSSQDSAAITAMSAASAAAAAARFVFRSAAAVRSAGVRLAGGPQPKFTRCPFRVPTQEQLSSRIFRSAVEIRCVCVDSLLPFHTATASALLTSMLSISPRCYGWIPEGKDKTR